MIAELIIRHKLASCFVQATTSNISDPFDGFIVRVVQFRLEHFQIANLEATGRKRNLEAH